MRLQLSGYIGLIKEIKGQIGPILIWRYVISFVLVASSAFYVKTISFGKDVHIELCCPNESKLRFHFDSCYIYSQI